MARLDSILDAGAVIGYPNAVPDELDALRGAIARCRVCRDAPQSATPLPHEPRPISVISQKTSILIASQAPGLRAHDSGVPFNDPSGGRLRQWLGVDPETFYNRDHFAIVPMGFCFPGYDAHGGDLPPRRECAPVWREPVLASMPQIRLILAIGHHAQRWHLGKLCPKSMTDTVAAWRSFIDPQDGTVPLLPLPHPSWRNTSWIKRHPWFETELLPVLRARVGTLLG